VQRHRRDIAAFTEPLVGSTEFRDLALDVHEARKFGQPTLSKLAGVVVARVEAPAFIGEALDLSAEELGDQHIECSARIVREFDVGTDREVKVHLAGCRRFDEPARLPVFISHQELSSGQARVAANTRVVPLR
jgi:hypothetical protein